jgi:hypothetical protein
MIGVSMARADGCHVKALPMNPVTLSVDRPQEDNMSSCDHHRRGNEWMSIRRGATPKRPALRAIQHDLDLARDKRLSMMGPTQARREIARFETALRAEGWGPRKIADFWSTASPQLGGRSPFQAWCNGEYAAVFEMSHDHHWLRSVAS